MEGEGPERAAVFQPFHQLPGVDGLRLVGRGLIGGFGDMRNLPFHLVRPSLGIDNLICKIKTKTVIEIRIFLVFIAVDALLDLGLGLFFVVDGGIGFFVERIELDSAQGGGGEGDDVVAVAFTLGGVVYGQGVAAREWSDWAEIAASLLGACATHRRKEKRIGSGKESRDSFCLGFPFSASKEEEEEEEKVRVLFY